MDGSAFRNMDLGRLFGWLLALSAVGVLALLVAGVYGLSWLIYHLQWVG